MRISDWRSDVCSSDLDEDAADQARAGGGGDAVQFRKGEAGLLHRLADQPVDVVEMAARVDLRHHTAVGTVLVELREDEVCADQIGRPSCRERGCQYV